MKLFSNSQFSKLPFIRRTITGSVCFLMGLWIMSFFFLSAVFAAAPSTPVELNGDFVEYSVDGNKIIASGNVIVVYQNATLTCDRIEFYRDSMIAHADGNVSLLTTQGKISGDKLTFNFETMRGDFHGTKIFSDPYYGKAAEVEKISENQILMRDGHITTCDFDKPQYRMASPRIEVYPGDKIVARNVRMLIGNVPVLWLPRFSQRIDDKKPRVIFIPGYDKKWGMFLLSSWRYYFSDNFKGIIHVDAREKKDIATGIDLDYRSPKYGKGIIRTYYMKERSLASKRFWEERPTPTEEKERFKVEWRHKWDIDENTNAILQYYRLSDDTILKDYFEKEYEKDSSPTTYMLLTKTIPSGTLSFRTEARVNRFFSAVERLPELRYDFSSKEILNTGLYFKDTTTYSNLTNKDASPSEVRKHTHRLDTDYELSYPMKVGIIELRPYVGGENTYYSRTKDPADYGSIRGIFKTGASLSTKFYRIFETKTDMFGLDIDRLRHIITPSVSYNFDRLPTTTSSQLDSFDGIDSRDQIHNIKFSLENKLQTKRNEESVDLLRAIIGVDFRLKDDPNGGGFDLLTSDIDFKPTDWLTFYSDATYDTRKEHLDTSNFDIYINGGEKWSFDLGKRYQRDTDDLITTELEYRVNQKWKFGFYNQFDIDTGTHKEQQYTVTRDLHSWEMELNFNETRTEGDEIWIIFRLKAFPDVGIDVGTSFNKRKQGSQDPAGGS